MDATLQNQSDQDGLAVAVATSGKVTVDQNGEVSAAGDGIDADFECRGSSQVRAECHSEQQHNQSITQTSPLALAPEAQPALENEQEADWYSGGAL